MNSSFVCISFLIKNNTNKGCLINFFNEITSKSLRDYLKLASI